MKVKKMLKIAGMVLVMSMFMVGCGGRWEKKDTSDEERVSVSVVVGAHSNANVISAKAEEIKKNVYESAFTYGRISLVRCDGNPEEFLVTQIKEPEVKGLSLRKKKHRAENFTKEILSFFNSDGIARYEENDTLEAIRLAANSLKAADNDSDKVLVVADTGLSTKGYLNFAENNLFEIPTSEIIEALEAKKAIPDLEGVKVVWLYAGQCAEPQEKLSEVQKAKLIEIWRAVLEKAGALSYDFKEDSASSKPYSGLPPVSVVDAESRDIEVKPLKKVVLDSSSVKFKGDQAIFVNKKAAKKAIGSVAKTLLDHPDNKVYVVGCTATAAGKEAFCKTLSEDRAQAVVEVLKDYGVPESQMLPVGLSDTAPWHIPDLDEKGYQIEKYAEQNRCVVILDTMDSKYGDVISRCMK